MWVADDNDNKLYAYNLVTKARDAAKDFNTLDAAGNTHPQDIWSDGITMWVVDYDDDKLYAYNLVTKTRDAAKDVNTLDAAGNNQPVGLWSDGGTVWVSDRDDDNIYAYSLVHDLVSSVSLAPLPSTFSSAMSVPLTLNATVTNIGIKDDSAGNHPTLLPLFRPHHKTGHRHGN